MLGLLPGAGGTQRLPRLVGAKRALGMMLFSSPMTAREAAQEGLIDRIVEGDVVAAAVEMAQSVPTIRRTGALPVPGDMAEAVQAAKSQLRPELSKAPGTSSNVWPQCGGPMLQGDLIGLPQLSNRLSNYAAGRNGRAWAPAPLVERRLAAEGRSFASLNG